jgi:hypothetical protein
MKRSSLLTSALLLLTACGSGLTLDEERQAQNEADDGNGNNPDDPSGEAPGPDDPGPGVDGPNNGNDPSPNGPTGPDSPSTVGPDGTSPSPNVPGPNPTVPGNPEDPAQAEESASPIRRLSHVEYWNTLRDLFPTLTITKMELAANETIDGFSNHWDALQPSDLLIGQYYDSAAAIAQALTSSDIAALSSCTEVACASQFVAEFGQRAFRRPLTDEEISSFAATFESEGPAADDFELGVRLTVLSMLQSASFLYRPEFGVGEVVDERKELDGFEAATRLSYFLWATMPDSALLEAAAAGELADAAGVQAQVQRMLSDERARDGAVTFFSEWLKLAKVNSSLKLPEDNWDETLRAEIHESAVRFVYDTVFVNDGSLADLMTSTAYAATPRVAALLGAEVSGDGWASVDADPAQRSGILTHPAFLAAHGYGEYPSPVLRGVYVMDRILCAPPQPPPGNVNMVLPQAEEGEPLTNREAYDQATAGDACQGCHRLINPFGFAFENYDTLGRYRTTDNDLAIDASGSALQFTFTDGIDLAHQFAENDVVRECAVRKALNYSFGGSPLATDTAMRDEISEAFTEKNYSLKGLFEAIASHERFAHWLSVGAAQE